MEHVAWGLQVDLEIVAGNFQNMYVRPRLLQLNGCAYTHEKVESKEFAMYYSMLCPKMHATRNGYSCVARVVKRSLRGRALHVFERTSTEGI